MADFLLHHWRTAIETALLGGVMVYAWMRMRAGDGVKNGFWVLFIMLGTLLVSHLTGLELLRYAVLCLGMVMAIVFQPELRRAFVSLGSHRFFTSARENMEVIDALQETVLQLSAKRCGALFAFERGMELDQYLETGVEMDSLFAPELVVTIFHPKTALHDGGMILRQGRILGAGCVFPVSQREMADRSIGLRHRAAIGISEQTDAIAVVVSEETGNISICRNGELEPGLTPQQFRQRLKDLLIRGSKESAEETLPASTATKRLEA